MIFIIIIMFIKTVSQASVRELLSSPATLSTQDFRLQAVLVLLKCAVPMCHLRESLGSPGIKRRLFPRPI
jgi:hypothetical protein